MDITTDGYNRFSWYCFKSNNFNRFSNVIEGFNVLSYFFLPKTKQFAVLLLFIVLNSIKRMLFFLNYFDILSLILNWKFRNKLYLYIAAKFSGAKYLVQGKRLSNEGDWLYLDGSLVYDFSTQWDSQANPTAKNKKDEYIVLQPHGGYTWLNSEESELVSGYVCEGWSVYTRCRQ